MEAKTHKEKSFLTNQIDARKKSSFDHLTRGISEQGEYM